jgi:carbamoyltransferase
MRTEMDLLVIENFVLAKGDQPKWQEKDEWQEEFELD